MTERVEQDAIYKAMSTTTNKTAASLESQFTFRSLWEKVTTKNYAQDSVKSTGKDNNSTDRKKQKNDSKQEESISSKRVDYSSTLASLESLPVMFANSFTLAEAKATDKSKDASVQASALQSLFTRCAKAAAIMEARDPSLGDKTVTVELPEELFDGMECKLTREDEGWELSLETGSDEDKEILLKAEDSLKIRFQELGLGDVAIAKKIVI